MSEWTYVRGSLQLNSSPFEIDANFNQVEPKREDFKSDKKYEKALDEYRTAYHNAIYLPYPEEQFKLGAPVIGSVPGKDKTKWKAGISFDDTYIYSLPRAKKYIEEAFKLFPQGELGFRYWLDQNSYDGRSCAGSFIHPCLYSYYHEAVDKLYSSFPTKWGSYWNFEKLNEYIGIEEDCSFETVSTIFCGVHTSLRDATAKEVMDSLINFIKYLNKYDILVESGYLEWYDTYTLYSGYRYAFRTGSWFGEYSIMKLDAETNKIIWKLEHKHPKKANTNKIDFDTFVDVETSEEGK